MSDTDKTGDKLAASVAKSRSTAKPAADASATRKRRAGPAPATAPEQRPRPSGPKPEGYSVGGLRWPD